MSKHMTLKDLFDELHVEDVERAIDTAARRTHLLAKKTKMNWRMMGWEGISEEDRSLCNNTWAFTERDPANYLFRRADMGHVITILELKCDNEDYLLGATNE